MEMLATHHSDEVQNLIKLCHVALDFDFSTALDVWARTNRRISIMSTSN